MKVPKHHPELPLGNDYEQGTSTTFVRALINAGVNFEEIVSLNKEWVDRLLVVK
jgi:hypothetical protein